MKRYWEQRQRASVGSLKSRARPMSHSIAELVHVVCVQWQLKPEPITLLVILIKRTRLCVAWAVVWQCWMSPPDCHRCLWLVDQLSGSLSQVSIDGVTDRWHCLHLLGFISVCGDNNEVALEQGGQETQEQLWILSSTPEQHLALASLIPSCVLGRQWPFGKAFLIILTAVEVAGNSQPEE